MEVASNRHSYGRAEGRELGAISKLQATEDVAELVLFRAEVGARVMAGAGAAGDSLDDANAGFFELLDLVRIV